MAHDDIWRNLQLASPAEAFWRTCGMPSRGEFGGLCNNALCAGSNADWYNKSSGHYYCDGCARHINETCLEQGRRKLCELHF